MTRRGLETFEQVLAELTRHWGAFGVLRHDVPLATEGKVIFHIELDTRYQAKPLSIWRKLYQRVVGLGAVLILTGTFVVPFFLFVLQVSGIDVLSLFLRYPFLLSAVASALIWVPLWLFDRFWGGYVEFYDYEPMAYRKNGEQDVGF